MNNINIFEQFPYCITSRVKLRGILTDIFPTERIKVNLILNAYDEGIIDDIQSSEELDSFMFGRWVKNIIDNYGISEDNAEWTIDFWFSNYGVAVCNKTYVKPIAEKSISKSPQKAKQSISLKKPTTAEGFVDVSKMNDGDKIPKSMVEIININSKGVKISTINCTVRKDYDINGATAIKFAGEYSGKTDKYLNIFIMLYNANNELINYESHIGIDEGFSGQGNFSETVNVPNDEFISKAVVRLALNPVFVYSN